MVGAGFAGVSVAWHLLQVIQFHRFRALLCICIVQILHLTSAYSGIMFFFCYCCGGV